MVGAAAMSAGQPIRATLEHRVEQLSKVHSSGFHAKRYVALDAGLASVRSPAGEAKSVLDTMREIVSTRFIFDGRRHVALLTRGQRANKLI